MQLRDITVVTHTTKQKNKRYVKYVFEIYK